MLETTAINELFPNNEIDKRNKMIQLMDDWKYQISQQPPITFHDDKIDYEAINYFGADGFLPNYYNQKNRVVFIGREARYNSENDSVHGIISYFNERTDMNASTFWRRILYIVYGIKTQGKYKYEDIPFANEIAAEMVKTKDYGFAQINISKYSNDRADGAKADYKLINRFFKDSDLEKRNYFLEQLELLEPDVIITANLWDGKIAEEHLNLCFPKLRLEKQIDDLIDYWKCTIANKEVKLLNLWHFSKPGSDQDNYYDPVMKMLFGK